MTDRITVARAAFAKAFADGNMIADGVLAVVDALKAWDAEEASKAMVGERMQELPTTDPPWLKEAANAACSAWLHTPESDWAATVRVVLAVARKHGAMK